LFAGVLSEKPPDISADDINGAEIIPGRVYQAYPRAYFPKTPGYFRGRHKRDGNNPQPGVSGFSAGVLSEKPPDISADDINGTEIIPGRVYQASPRACFTKNPRIFPRTTSQ
jgi:hypothetical protein